MPRTTRVLAAAAGLITTTSLLAACDKPAPKITVLGDDKVVTVSASSYCFDADKCRPAEKVDLPKLTVGVDDKVLVDVPRDVFKRGWVVSALSLDGKTTLGTSGEIEDSHSYRVASNINNGQPFVVQVNEVRGGKATESTWSFVVQVSPTKS